MSELLNSNKIDKKDVQVFTNTCLNFYELTIQIFKRFDFKNPIFRKIYLISPEVIINQKSSSIVELALLFPNLILNENIQSLDLE